MHVQAMPYAAAAVNRRAPCLYAEVLQGRLAAALILRLLVTWCDGCPPAVAALLDTPSHLPLIIDIVAGRLGPCSLNLEL